MLEKAHGMRYNSKAASHICRCVELVDVVDSKSTAGDSVPVRVRSPAPRRCGRHIVRSDFFIKKSLLTHSVAAPFRIRTRFAGLRFGFLFETQNVYYPAPTFFFKSQSALTPLLLLLKPKPAALGFAWVIPDGKRKFCIDKYVKIPHILGIWGTFCSYGMAQTESGIRTAGDRLTPAPAGSVRSSRASARWASRPRAARCGQTRCLRPARPPAG